jgi:hypothetical protein
MLKNGNTNVKEMLRMILLFTEMGRSESAENGDRYEGEPANDF